MNIIKDFIKKHFIVLVFLFMASLLVSLYFMRTIGKKDAIMVMTATFLLLVEIFLIKIDKKKSILLFILSFPIVVTARKICYFDILFFRISYETIYITFIFMASFQNIIAIVKDYLREKKSAKFNFTLLIFIFVIFAINSSIYSHNILRSLSEVYISIVVPVMFAFSILANMDKDDVIHIIYVFIAGIDMSCLYGFMQIFMNRIPPREIRSHRDLLTFGYHNINIFASILMIIMPFLIELILYRKNTLREKMFLYTSSLITVGALLLTFTRGAWLTFFICVFLMLLSKKYRKIIYGFIVIGIFAAKPMLSFILRRGTSTSFLSDESAIARIQSIFTSVKLILKYPFGVGGGNFAAMFKKYSDAGYMMMSQNFRWKITVANYALENAHNLWLQIAVEFGIICAVVFLLIVINRIKLALKDYEKNRACFVSIIIYIIFSVLTGIEFNHKGVITSTLIIWTVFSMIQLNSKETETEKFQKSMNKGSF